ncbi:lysophospholipid acyltransferase family protein [Streptomyces sp. NRRL S-495]|uniref:lysophospholipid acyltransferase family protein n=1 Tax=Streptomyces sp. NRRL S-495 TaxID=1609133 RepID=UPI000696985D|nr:lysophospholipid acyltransferase family protein [Streptomyces sp. NRRL S-495]
MSVWLPTASCTPEACLTDPAPTVALPRRVLRLAGFLVLLVAGLALIPPARLLPHRPRGALARFWARGLLGALGVAVRIVPAPAPVGRGGVLLVANHVSWLDIPLIAAVRPGRSVAKTEVRDWPVLGRLVAWGGTVFLDRDRLRALPATVAEVADRLRAGHPVIVFPEGSTWCGRESGRFRPAFFEAAVRSGSAPARLDPLPAGRRARHQRPRLRRRGRPGHLAGPGGRRPRPGGRTDLPPARPGPGGRPGPPLGGAEGTRPRRPDLGGGHRLSPGTGGRQNRRATIR